MGFHVSSKDGIAELAFEFGSANAMSTDFLSGLERALDDSKDARALVLVGRGKAFCAGLDLPALLTLDEASVHHYITVFGRVMERVFALEVPTVAALNGHAVAGGFVLACTADFRLAARGEAKIGMTGVALGIAYPSFVPALLQYALPCTAWHPVLLEGRLFSVDEALDNGLIHGVAEPGALLAAAVDKAKRLADGDPGAYARTKHMLKLDTLRRARAEADESHKSFVRALFSPPTRARLEAAALRLKTKSR